jgi:hypothetical protein
MKVIKKCKEMELVEFLKEEWIKLRIMVVDEVKIKIIRNWIEDMD